MKDFYDPDEENIYLEYVEASNHYRWAMLQNLPTQVFMEGGRRLYS